MRREILMFNNKLSSHIQARPIQSIQRDLFRLYLNKVAWFRINFLIFSPNNLFQPTPIYNYRWYTESIFRFAPSLLSLQSS